MIGQKNEGEETDGAVGWLLGYLPSPLSIKELVIFEDLSVNEESHCICRVVVGVEEAQIQTTGPERSWCLFLARTRCPSIARNGLDGCYFAGGFDG